MANLVYRKSTSPNTNAITAFKGSPLTNDELDNNFFGIDAEVQTKAPVNNAVFTGSTTIPNIIVSGGTVNGTAIGGTTRSTGAFTNLLVGDNLPNTITTTVDGSSITTTSTTFNLVNATATTLNLGGAATAVTVGATTGTATIRNSSLLITGSVAVNTDKFTIASASGNTTVAGTLSVVSDVSFGPLGTPKFTVAGTTGNTGVLGTLNVSGDVTIGSNKFTIANSSGNTAVAGTLAVVSDVSFGPLGTPKFTVVGTSGNTTVLGTLNVTGVTTLNNNLLGTTCSFSGQISSTVAIGTAPFIVTSTTKVANLNADFVDGFTADQANIASNIVVRDASKNINISNAVMSGATSGTTTLQPTAISGSSVLTLPAATDTLVGKATTDTFTNKTINLASNTLIGTLTEFNNALNGADFVSIAGNETLTNKTLTSPAINTATIVGGTIDNAPIGATTRAAGSFTTLSANSTLGVTGVTTLSNNLNGTTCSFSGQITSTVADGTTPFLVTSTTKVANLNADFVDGFTADQANTASNIVVRDASKNINISNVVMSGSTSGTTTLQPTSAASGTLTLPAATDTLVGRATADTLTNKTLTSPTINGGTQSAITAFGIRDTSAAFDVTIAATSSIALTAGRTLTLDLVNAARTVKLAGNIALAGNFTTSGAFGVTLTATALTSVTLPTTGTLATLAGSETLTNKTLTSPTINGGTINNIVIGGTTAAAGSFTTLSSDSLTSTGEVSGLTLKSTATTGTAPLTVSSSTKVTNLNADSVDGIGFAAVNTSGVAGTDQRGGVAYALDASNITYVPPGTSGKILQSSGAGAAPIWVEPTGLSAGSSALAANISGGVAGQLLFQGAADTTSKLSIGTANTVLTSSGIAPQWSNSLTLAGTITHGGLTPSAGTNVDQLYTATDSGLVVTTEWVDTSVNATELANGSYMVQVSTGSGTTLEFHTGVMSWFSGDANTASGDEILLHRASAGTDASNLFLRVYRSAVTTTDMVLQISASSARTSASYTYKFRRMM